MEFSWQLPVLVIVGFVAGFLNTVAGGGSLLTLPMLIFLGLPPNVANGTNRIAIILQNVFSTAGFKSKGISTFPFSAYIGFVALIGALVGAQIAVDIKGESFNKILAVVMIIVVAIMVFKPTMSLTDVQERTKGKYFWLSLVIFFFVGMYGGFIQAGVGFIMLLVLTSLNGFSLVKSNATKVMVALIYTLGAVVMFAINDKINWSYGLIMAAGNASGGWVGSRWSVKKGDKAIKVFLVIVVVVMSAKLWFGDLLTEFVTRLFA